MLIWRKNSQLSFLTNSSPIELYKSNVQNATCRLVIGDLHSSPVLLVLVEMIRSLLGIFALVFVAGGTASPPQTVLEKFRSLYSETMTFARSIDATAPAIVRDVGQVLRVINTIYVRVIGESSNPSMESLVYVSDYMHAVFWYLEAGGVEPIALRKRIKTFERLWKSELSETEQLTGDIRRRLRERQEEDYDTLKSKFVKLFNDSLSIVDRMANAGERNRRLLGPSLEYFRNLNVSFEGQSSDSAQRMIDSARAIGKFFRERISPLYPPPAPGHALIEAALNKWEQLTVHALCSFVKLRREVAMESERIAAELEADEARRRSTKPKPKLKHKHRGTIEESVKTTLLPSTVERTEAVKTTNFPLEDWDFEDGHTDWEQVRSRKGKSMRVSTQSPLTVKSVARKIPVRTQTTTAPSAIGHSTRKILTVGREPKSGPSILPVATHFPSMGHSTHENLTVGSETKSGPSTHPVATMSHSTHENLTVERQRKSGPSHVPTIVHSTQHNPPVESGPKSGPSTHRPVIPTPTVPYPIVSEFCRRLELAKSHLEELVPLCTNVVWFSTSKDMQEQSLIVWNQLQQARLAMFQIQTPNTIAHTKFHSSQ